MLAALLAAALLYTAVRHEPAPARLLAALLSPGSAERGLKRSDARRGLDSPAGSPPVPSSTPEPSGAEPPHDGSGGAGTSGRAGSSQRAAASGESGESGERRFFPSVGSSAEPFIGGEAADAVRTAFRHAWAAYERDAWGMDELHPVSHTGSEWFSLGLAIIDSLDTMLVMGLKDDYSKARRWVQQNLAERLASAGDVNLFEATIRVLGGLLAAYALEGDELFMSLAQDTGQRLLPAFQSPSGVPYSDVNLASGAAHGPTWGGASSTAEVSTVQLEFRYLAALSRQGTDFREPADRAELAVIEATKRQGYGGLAPIFIDPATGTFESSRYSLGARGDSYYEYLLKLWIQAGGADGADPFGPAASGPAVSSKHRLDNAYLRASYLEATESIRHRMLRVAPGGGSLEACVASQAATGSSCGDTGPDQPSHQLLYLAELSPDLQVIHKMDHLACFYPGLLALGWAHGLGRHPEDPLRDHLEIARRLAYTCTVMYRDTATGLAPEIVYFGEDPQQADQQLPHLNRYGERRFETMSIKFLDTFSLLRPEVVESLFVLFRITGDERYRRWGWDMFQAMEQHAKLQPHGFASVEDVTAQQAVPRDKMETFFLAETLKYLFLLFSPDSALDLDKFVLNTEAHPLPIMRPPRTSS